MRFIDENSLHRLNFKELLSRVDVLSAYGKQKLNSIENFLLGQEEKLEKEFERMKKIQNFISENKREIMEIEVVIHRFKDIKKVVENSLVDIILDTVDIFEIKTQIMSMIDLNNYLIKNENIFYDLVFKLETSTFNDRIYPSIIIEDMKPSDLEDDRFHFYHSMYYTSFPMKSLFYTNLDIDKNDKIYLKRNFESYSVFKGQKSIAKLDKNISNLLSCLENFYEYSFEIKIENIHTFKNHKIIDILIKRK